MQEGFVNTKAVHAHACHYLPMQIAHDYKNKKRGEETLEPLYREEDEWMLLTNGELYEELGDTKKFMEILMGWRIF